MTIRPLQVPTITINYFLGVDPGLNTGVALWDARGSRFLYVRAVSFWDATELIYSEYVRLKSFCPGDMQVVIENPKAISTMYAKHDEYQGRVRTKIAQSVGSNKRDAELLMEFCERKSIPYQAVMPSKGTGSKEKASVFKRLTKFEGSTNQHGRDAGMLVFGMRPRQIPTPWPIIPAHERTSPVPAH